MGKVLFVDSNLALLALYSEEFRDEGYEVLVARNGEEALGKYRENSPQVVVMDPHVPDMDEIELLRSLFALDSRASVIIYEAYPQPEDFWTPRVGRPILKSSDFTELKSKIREILSGSGKRDKWSPKWKYQGEEGGLKMEQLQTKRGKIETIGEKKITILNLDGLCRDTFEVTPGEASYIRDKFGLDVEILYSVKGNRLVHMWPDEEVPELRGLYEAFPKVTECTAPIEGGEARWDGVFSL